MTKKELARKTKAELAKLLGLNAKAVKAADGSLFDRLVYADRALKKDAKSVTKGDLLELASDALDALGDKFREGETRFITPAAAETIENREKPEDAPEDAPKKKPSKKQTAAEAAKKVLGVKKEREPEAKPMFPEVIETEAGKYARAKDITSLAAAYGAVENSEDLVFAFYWSKKQLRQFPYFNEWLGQPKSFEGDLDLCSLIYISDEKKVAYLVSMYTEAMYTLLPRDFDEVEGFRFCNGVEFQAYRKVASTADGEADES